MEFARDVNGKMQEHVVMSIGDLLNEERTAVNGSRLLLLGVAYKADVSDVRESPALDVLRLLDEKGAEVRYHDPYVPELALEGRTWKSVELTDEELGAADLVVIVTDHSSIDYAPLLAKTHPLYHTRNATRAVREGREKIRK